MNFLQLCQRTAQETGTVSGLLPVTVSGQAGRLKKIVDAVAAAWTLIQAEHNDWQWMRHEYQVSVAVGLQRIAPAAKLPTLARWITGDRAHSIFVFAGNKQNIPATGADECYLRELPWGYWRQLYNFGTQTAQRPYHYAISPANELCLGPAPDVGYSLKGEYWAIATALAADGDVPECPDDYHLIIVWRALMLMAEQDEADKQLGAASGEYGIMKNRMDHDARCQPLVEVTCEPLA